MDEMTEIGAALERGVQVTNQLSDEDQQALEEELAELMAAASLNTSSPDTAPVVTTAGAATVVKIVEGCVQSTTDMQSDSQSAPPAKP